MFGTKLGFWDSLFMWAWNRVWDWAPYRWANSFTSKRKDGRLRFVIGCRSWVILLRPWPKFSWRIFPWHWVLNVGFVMFSFNRFPKS